MNDAVRALDARAYGGADSRVGIYNSEQPPGDAQPAIKWDGEWPMNTRLNAHTAMAFMSRRF